MLKMKKLYFFFLLFAEQTKTNMSWIYNFLFSCTERKNSFNGKPTVRVFFILKAYLKSNSNQSVFILLAYFKLWINIRCIFIFHFWLINWRQDIFFIVTLTTTKKNKIKQTYKVDLLLVTSPSFELWWVVFSLAILLELNLIKITS